MQIVIFDLDGVLIDSSVLYANALKDSLDRRGFDFPMEEIVEATIPHVGQWIETVLPEDLTNRASAVEELIAEVRGAMPKLCSGLELRQNARRILDRMAASHDLFLLTNSSSAFTQKILARHDLEEVFSRVITSDDGFGPKEKAIEHLAEANATKLEEVTYIGDTTQDVRCARKAGCRVVIIYSTWSWDHGRRDEIEAAGPDALVEELGDLPEVLERGWE